MSSNPEKQPLVEHSPAKLSIIAESGDLKSAVGNTSPVSTMENCSQQDVEVSMRDDVCMERFQVRLLFVHTPEDNDNGGEKVRRHALSTGFSSLFFQISRKSWIMCIGVNVFVIFITVGFVIMANTR